MAFPIALFVFHRAMLLLMAGFGLRLIPTMFVPSPTPFSEPVHEQAISGLCRWDCGLYHNLANRGYATLHDTQTFPLYPLIVRAFASLTGMRTLYSLVFIANLAGLGSLLIIYRIFTKLSDQTAARWGLLALTAFPFSFFHAAGHAESLTIFFASAGILLALDEHYLLAGVALALGSATRHVALFAVPSILAIAIYQRGFRWRALILHRSTLALFIPLLGVGTYSLYCYLQFHDALAFIHARTFGAPNNYWQVRAWWSILEAFRGGRTRTEPLLYSYVFWSLIPWAGAIGLLWKRSWRPLAPYAILLMTLYWVSSLMGLGRFSASCWPAFLPVGWWLARRPAIATPALVALAMAQGFYFYLWTHWFGIW